MPGIDLDVSDGVAIVTLNRPPANAWDAAQLDELEAVMAQLRSDSDIRVAVVRGAGRYFSAGADIAMMVDAGATGDEGLMDAFGSRMQALYAQWEGLPTSTLAVVHGAATGGGLELALASDLRVATDTARIGLPEVKLGLLAAAGGTQRLTRLAGRATALRLTLTGELVTGAEAEHLGIVQWSCPEADLDAVVDGIVRALVDQSGPAQRWIKQCVAASGTPDGYLLETNGQRELRRLEDTRARLEAFIEQRRR